MGLFGRIASKQTHISLPIRIRPVPFVQVRSFGELESQLHASSSLNSTPKPGVSNTGKLVP